MMIRIIYNIISITGSSEKKNILLLFRQCGIILLFILKQIYFAVHVIFITTGYMIV
jgi:hypothetical protein